MEEDTNILTPELFTPEQLLAVDAALAKLEPGDIKIERIKQSGQIVSTFVYFGVDKLTKAERELLMIELTSLRLGEETLDVQWGLQRLPNREPVLSRVTTRPGKPLHRVKLVTEDLLPREGANPEEIVRPEEVVAAIRGRIREALARLDEGIDASLRSAGEEIRSDLHRVGSKLNGGFTVFAQNGKPGVSISTTSDKILSRDDISALITAMKSNSVYRDFIDIHHAKYADIRLQPSFSEGHFTVSAVLKDPSEKRSAAILLRQLAAAMNKDLGLATTTVKRNGQDGSATRNGRS